MERGQLAMTKMLWMRENQPQLLLEHHRKGTLGRKVVEEVEEAIKLEQELMRTTEMNPIEIQEVVLNKVAPAEQMAETLDNEEVISEKLFNRIVKTVLP